MKGQAVLEYTLLLVVVMVVMMSVMSKVSDFFVGEGECPNQSFLCNFQEVYSGQGYLDGSYRYFTIRR